MKIIIILFLLIVFIVIVCYQSSKEGLKMSAGEKRKTNTILSAGNLYKDAMDILPLPDSIKDAYNEWIYLGFVSPVKDQMLCGGCWAFATCATIADRITIATNGKWYAPYGLSEQILLSCGTELGMKYYQGCQGGIPHFAIDALKTTGVPADSKCTDCGEGGQAAPGGIDRGGSGVVNPTGTSGCGTSNVYAPTPYTWWQNGCDSTSTCLLTPSSQCPCDSITQQMKDRSNPDTPFDIKYKTVDEAHNYTVHGDNEAIHTVDLWPDIPQNIIDENVIRMKKAIYYEGPITVAYRVTNDFFTFWNQATADNYYQYDGRSAQAGGHAVIAVGWKILKDGTPVWIVKNSWGTSLGYGFPDGPKWKNPATGKEEPMYPGGFWNHIMGVNDSFIESNAVGPHPDLSLPDIAKYLPNGGKDIPKEWNKTMTLREIWKKTAAAGPGISPVSPPPTSPDYSPLLPIGEPVDITSDSFTVINLSPDNMTPHTIDEFFANRLNLYIAAANHTENLKKVISYLPPDKTALSESDMSAIIEQLISNIKGYVVVAARGDLNNYYYLAGDPSSWKGVFNKRFANRAATSKKFANDVYSLVQGLGFQAPVVELSKKN